MLSRVNILSCSVRKPRSGPDGDRLMGAPDLNLKSFYLNDITLGGAIWRTFRAINLPISICTRDLRSIMLVEPQRDTNRAEKNGERRKAMETEFSDC